MTSKTCIEYHCKELFKITFKSNSESYCIKKVTTISLQDDKKKVS